MKTVYKRQMYMGTIGDMKNLEQHFSCMAEQGWMLDKIGVFTHRYRSADPCKKYFFVDLLPQITTFDYPENEDAQDYRSICEESGWDFVAANKQFHVFCADGENPTPMPIHTDNKIQAQIYLKACRKYELPMFFISLLMLWFFSPLGRGVDLFLSNMMLFTAIGYCFFLIGYLWTFGFVLRWYFLTKKAAKKDLPMPTPNHRLARIRNNIIFIGLVAYFVCAIAGIVLDVARGMSAIVFLTMLFPLSGLGVGLWLRRQIDTKKRERRTNIMLFIITLVILVVVLTGSIIMIANRIITSPLYSNSLGERPALTLRDVGVTTPPDNIYTRIQGTIAVPVNYEHWESNRQGIVITTVLRSVNKSLTRALYDSYARDFVIKFNAYAHHGRSEQIIYLEKYDAALWGADRGMAFFLEDSNAVDLLLLKDKKLLRLSFNGEYTSLESISQAVQALWRD